MLFSQLYEIFGVLTEQQGYFTALLQASNSAYIKHIKFNPRHS